jgi:hypothetical protein
MLESVFLGRDFQNNLLFYREKNMEKNSLMQQHARSISALALMLLALFTIALVLFLGKFVSLPFKSSFLWQGEMLDMVTALVVIAIFAERSVEVVLVTVRTPQRQRIEYQISQLQALSETRTDDEKLAHRLCEKVYELDVYKLGTARFAHWLSFFFGLLISLAGIRALSALVDPETLKIIQNSTLHGTFFGAVDVIVTGGVIAGGSAAIDKMGRKIRKTFDLNSTGGTTAYREAQSPPAPSPTAAPPPWPPVASPEFSGDPAASPMEGHPAAGYEPDPIRRT